MVGGLTTLRCINPVSTQVMEWNLTVSWQSLVIKGFQSQTLVPAVSSRTVVRSRTFRRLVSHGRSGSAHLASFSVIEF